jgi:hemoglobin
MEIEAAEFDAACDDILGTMEALNYDVPTRREVRDILQSLKSDIIHV